MSTRRSDVPRLIFTVTRIEPRKYHYNDNNPPLGLIFVDREEPLHPRRTAALMRDERVREVMGDFYVGGTFRWSTHGHERYFRTAQRYHHDPAGDQHAIIINQHNICTPTAFHAPDTRLYVMVEGRLHKTTAHEVYANCRELHRLIGCHACPVSLDECMRRHTRLGLDQLNLPNLDLAQCQDLLSERFLQRRQQQTFCLGDIEDDWPYWKTEIGGHTFVPPALVSFAAVMPGKHYYLPFELSFDDSTINGNRDELSERSKRAAQTRRTKQVECANCYFGGKGYGGTAYPCDKYAPRWCMHGAWTEEQVIDETLGHFEHTLKLSGFTMRNFEQLLAIAGSRVYIRDNGEGPYKYVIRGFGFDHVNPPQAKIRLLRVTAEMRGHVLDFTSFDQLLPLLKPDLRRTFEEAPSLDRETLAVAAQLTCSKAIESYTCMQGCIRQVQPEISHITVTLGTLVEIGYWLRSYWKTRCFSSLADIRNHLDELPMFDIVKTPKEGVLDFRYAHWPR